MALTDQDKCDLLALISGLGDAPCNIRAQNLLKSDRDAIEFVREMNTVQAAFRPPRDENSSSTLSRTEANAITKAVLKRAGAAVEAPAPARFRVGKFIAVAACLVLLLVPSVWFLVFRQPALGDVVVVETGSKLEGYKGIKTLPRVIQKDSMIQTQNEFAVISFQKNQRITLDVMSSIRIHEKNRVELQSGSILVDASNSITVQISETSLYAEGGKFTVGLLTDGFVCELSRGKATVRVDNHDYVLTPGQRGVWRRSISRMSIKPIEHVRRSPMEAATQP